MASCLDFVIHVKSFSLVYNFYCVRACVRVCVFVRTCMTACAFVHEMYILISNCTGCVMKMNCLLFIVNCQ